MVMFFLYHFWTCFLKYEKLKSVHVIFWHFLCCNFSLTGETSSGCRISWITVVWLSNQIQGSLKLIVELILVLRYHLIIHKLVLLTELRISWQLRINNSIYAVLWIRGLVKENQLYVFVRTFDKFVWLSRDWQIVFA